MVVRQEQVERRKTMTGKGWKDANSHLPMLESRDRIFYHFDFGIPSLQNHTETSQSHIIYDILLQPLELIQKITRVSFLIFSYWEFII